MKPQIDKLGRKRHPNQSAGRLGIAKPGGHDGGAKLRCPSHLGPLGKSAWKSMKETLSRRKLLDSSDAAALEMWAGAYEEYRIARESVMRDGLILECPGTGGEIIAKSNPAASAMADAWKRLKSMVSEFGIAPAARSKLKSGEDEGKDPFEEFMNS